MATDDGGAAYPCPINVEDPESSNPLVIESAGGMTLLDHFAALAMQVYITAQYESNVTPCDVLVDLLENVPGEAYTIAAAMIAEKRLREKGTTP